MPVEVILNQDSIWEFPLCPHILSICNLKYHTWISVYLFFQNGHVMMSPANQLQGQWSFLLLIGWWHHYMTISKFKCDSCHVMMSPSNQLQGQWSFVSLIGWWHHYMTTLNNKRVHWNSNVIFWKTNIQNMLTSWKNLNAILIYHDFYHNIVLV